MTGDTRTRSRRLLWIAAGAIAVAAIISVAAVLVLSSSDLPSSEADRLFADTRGCDTTRVGYAIEVTFPAEWWTNSVTGDWPACSWFAPRALDVPTEPFQSAPDGEAISLGVAGGPPMPFAEAISVISNEELEVGGRPAMRVESTVPSADEGEARQLIYWVSLASRDGGPTLVALTSTDNAGDYQLNKAVLDRMMERLVIQDSPGD